MSAPFRNVTTDASEPVEQWPYEAIVTAIERGTIGDWVRITREIRDDPWGPVARQVEDYLGYAQPYGVGELLRRRVLRARSEAAAQDRAEVAAEVSNLLDRSGLSMAELALRIGTSRSRFSTYRSGTVVPSAATLVRLRRVVARLSS